MAVVFGTVSSPVGAHSAGSPVMNSAVIRGAHDLVAENSYSLLWGELWSLL